MEYSSLETFFDTRNITNKEEYLITRVKKSFKGYRTGYRGYSKKIWVNNLAEYYKQKGYQVSGHGETIIKKILDTTGLRYGNVLNWLDQKYKQSIKRLDFYRDQIIQDYDEIKNLRLISEKYNISEHNMSLFLKKCGIDVVKRPRHQLQIEKLTTPESFSFLGSGTLYRMKAGYCDYLYKDPLTMNCTLIEEKETLSSLNCGNAISQLIVGQKIVEEKTDYKVTGKIILCHKVSALEKKRARLEHILTDIKKYLGIEMIDLSSL